MTSTAIEWRATNLVALGEELRDKVARVTQQFDQRASSARSRDEANRLRQRLAQLVESIQDSFRIRLTAMSENGHGGDDSLYDRSLAGIDMDALVCLVWLCNGLGVDPRFIEQVLNAARRGVD